MDNYLNGLLQHVRNNPTTELLQALCIHFEIWDTREEKSHKLKMAAIDALKKVRTLPQFSGNENLLRLYNLIGKHSGKLGAAGIFDSLFEEGTYNHILKFYLLWGDSYAKKADLDKFRTILQHARSLVQNVESRRVEDEFRELAEKYFPTAGIFEEDEEETAMLFNTAKPKKNRRRSSVARFQEMARPKEIVTAKIESSKETKNKFDKNSTAVTPIRFELIDRREDNYYGISMEDMRAAMFLDKADLDSSDMDLEMNYTTAVVDAKSVAMPISKPVTAFVHVGNENKPPNRLETLKEDNEDGVLDEKRRRLESPKQPTREAKFQRRDTGVVLDMEMPAKTEKRGLTPRLDTVATSPARKDLSLLGGGSFDEQVYRKTTEVFSETIGPKTGGQHSDYDDPTMPLQSKPVEAFEVFVDPEESQVVQTGNTFTIPSAETGKNDARRPLAEMGEKKLLFDDEEMTLAGAKFNEIGIAKKPNFGHGIVTSTPCTGITNRIGHDQFVSAVAREREKEELARMMEKLEKNERPDEEDEDAEDTEEEDEPTFSKSAFTKLRRKSFVPAKANQAVSNVPKAPVNAAAKKNYADGSISSAMGQMHLGTDPASKQSIGENVQTIDHKKMGAVSSESAESTETAVLPEPFDDDEVDLDATGVGLKNEAVTSAINPWDTGLRQHIIRERKRKPTDQHDYDTPLPKVRVGRQITLGGEQINVLHELGRGNFAIVFLCQNEDKKKIALKYEVPSSAWEVYVCDQLKQRLRAQHSPGADFALKCIMQVTDAYVFSNCVVIMNEYLPHGTLLDLANKMKDPSWMIVLLLAIHMAKILREVHAMQVIHADFKPDNVMVTTKLDSSLSPEEVLRRPLLRVIDWGRSIDMSAFTHKEFKGRAGTENFDCPEMLDGRPWSYQTDYFGYIATLFVIVNQAYSNPCLEHGKYIMTQIIKRRLPIRDLLMEMTSKFLNIPSCHQLPSWDDAIEEMEGFFLKNFKASDWRGVVNRFNESLPQNH